MNRLFVFDLDDTLMANVHDYTEPLQQAVRIIVRELGQKAPHLKKIIDLEEEIDNRRFREINPENQKPFLCSMERFPGTLVETYRQLCRNAGVSTDTATETLLYETGLTAFDENQYQKNVFPSARTLLGFLYHRNDRLILCSQGDRRVQQKKVEALEKTGIFHFGAIHIVDEKTSDFFKHLINDAVNFNCYSVGNSFESDIVPALNAGLKGILIPTETWRDNEISEDDEKAHKIQTEVDRGLLHVLKDLEELKVIYHRL